MRYRSSDYFMRPTLIETMAAMSQTDYDGQMSFESFEHFTGLDEAICQNVEELCREAFGKKFVAIRTYGKRDELSVFVHSAAEGKVALSLDFRVEYSGFFDFLAGREMKHLTEFHRIFDHISRGIRARLKAQYPVDVFMTHRYAHNKKLSLQIEVRCDPAMQMAAAA